MLERPRDVNQLAVRIVAEATGDVPEVESVNVQNGRLGGLKGGKARAAKLSPERRREIAQKAARTRWQAK